MNRDFSYLLVDTALIESLDTKPWLKKRRCPDWISPLYDHDAIVVSPVLIDIERAFECNRIDVMMDLANAQNPPLHASIIETDLKLQELTEHLRKFIYVISGRSEEMTLRLADSVVLMALSKSLDRANWNAIVGPISRWSIHQLDGSLFTLPCGSEQEPFKAPLAISPTEENSIRRELLPHQVLQNISLRNAPLISEFQIHRCHELVSAAMQKCMEAQATSIEDLIQIAEGTLSTRGAILSDIELPGILMERDTALRLERFKQLTYRYSTSCLRE